MDSDAIKQVRIQWHRNVKTEKRNRNREQRKNQKLTTDSCLVFQLRILLILQPN